jgi:hypothetical protein
MTSIMGWWLWISCILFGHVWEPYGTFGYVEVCDVCGAQR